LGSLRYSRISERRMLPGGLSCSRIFGYPGRYPACLPGVVSSRENLGFSEFYCIYTPRRQRIALLGYRSIPGDPPSGVFTVYRENFRTDYCFPGIFQPIPGIWSGQYTVSRGICFYPRGHFSVNTRFPGVFRSFPGTYPGKYTVSREIYPFPREI
jgi:hypothetical protein